MVDRNKVINGLELCLNSGFTCSGDCEAYEDCPYSVRENGCISNIMADALALLEAQEPKLLTLEKVQGSEECWIEFINSSVRVADVSMSAETIEGKNVSEIVTIGTDWDNPSFAFDDEYGIKWRCWNKKPTNEQRQNTPWKE